jgi:sulfatase maturation enzyme AslB (radical SAM superfamily)
MTLMNEKVIDLWRKFDNVKISCSIDDLGIRNEYIRYPTNWDTVMKNFLRLKEEDFELDVTQTVSFMNYSTLGEFYNFFNKEHDTYVYHNIVYDPAILSPAVLPKIMRDDIHKEFIKVFDKRKSKELINMFSMSDNESQWKNAVEYTKELDEIREQYIGDYLPEFREII